MAKKWFHPPIAIETDRIGQTYMVNSVESASQQLLSWDERGPKWYLAAETCLLALEGKKMVEEAYDAFREAARETEKLMTPTDIGSDIARK